MPSGIYKRIKKDSFELFIIKVNKTDKCWEWLGYKERKGYGKFVALGESLAHRFSYKYFKGVIPKKMQVCHSCDNPSCVNPEHLWLGTNYDNQMDSIKKGRDRKNSPKGEKNGLSKLKEKQIIKIVKMYKDGLSQQEIGKRFKCHQSTIHYILSNKTWKHVKKKFI